MLVIIAFWFLIQGKAINLNIISVFFTSLSKINLNKVWCIMFGAAVILYFVSGLAYQHIYTDKIVAREQHLLSVADSLGIPQGAKKLDESFFKRMFAIVYKTKYQYEPEDKISFYLDKLEDQQYEIVRARDTEIIGKKNGVIVTIDLSEGKIYHFFEFDDFFERWNL